MMGEMDDKPLARYVPIFKPGTKGLLCKFDPVRDIIEIQDRGVKYVVDLAQERLRAQEGAPDERQETKPDATV